MPDLKKIRRQLDLLNGGAETIYPTGGVVALVRRRFRTRFLRANLAGRPDLTARMGWKPDREEMPSFEDAAYRLSATREVTKRLLASLTEDEVKKVVLGDV